MFEGLQNRMAIEMCAGPTSEKACNHGLEPCGPEGRQWAPAADAVAHLLGKLVTSHPSCPMRLLFQVAQQSGSG